MPNQKQIETNELLAFIGVPVAALMTMIGLFIWVFNGSGWAAILSLSGVAVAVISAFTSAYLWQRLADRTEVAKK